MTHVSNISGPSGTRLDASPTPGVRPGAEAAPAVEAPHREPDSVDLSEHARLLETLRENNAIRTELISQVRAEIAAGTYETPERLERALDALAEDLQS